MPPAIFIWIVTLIIGIIFLVIGIALLNIANLALQAAVSSARVNVLDILGMKLRRVDARRIVLAAIRAKQGGVPVSTDKLETHLRAGGDLEAVIDSLVDAQRKGLEIDRESAASLDLGRSNA